MIKVGVIGAGNMGRHHVRIYSELERCELVGLADPDESRAELADTFKTQYFVDHRRLLEKQPQLVTIAAPTTNHVELARDALDAGCHLLIEKPISADVQAAQDLVDYARQKARMIAVGHIERFNPAIVALKSLIDIGELGDVLTVHNLRVSPYHGRILDTGIVLDIGVHDVDLISMLMGGRGSSVFATGFQRIHSHEDHAVIQVAFDDGRSGVVELSWNAPYRIRHILVSGARRYALCDLIDQRLVVYEEDSAANRLMPVPKPVAKGEPLRAELASVIECVENGTPPVCKPADSIYALEACLAALKSMQSGQVEKVGG